MSMELVLGNDDLTWKIFSRLTELRDIMRADEVNREWHTLMQDDRVWEPLCRMHKGRGPLAAAGFGMLATLKENTQLSWRQLFVQRARALQPLSDEDSAPRARRREDFMLGAEVYLMGRRERVHGDAQDDAAVLAELRNVLTREQYAHWRRDPEPPRKQPARRSKKTAPPAKKPKKEDISQLIQILTQKRRLQRFVLPHLVELFGPAMIVDERKEWVLKNALRILDELHPDEPNLELPAIDAEAPKKPPSAFGMFADAQRKQLEQLQLHNKQAGSAMSSCQTEQVDPRLVEASEQERKEKEEESAAVPNSVHPGVPVRRKATKRIVDPSGGVSLVVTPIVTVLVLMWKELGENTLSFCG